MEHHACTVLQYMPEQTVGADFAQAATITSTWLQMTAAPNEQAQTDESVTKRDSTAADVIAIRQQSLLFGVTGKHRSMMVASMQFQFRNHSTVNHKYQSPAHAGKDSQSVMQQMTSQLPTTKLSGWMLYLACQPSTAHHQACLQYTVLPVAGCHSCHSWHSAKALLMHQHAMIALAVPGGMSDAPCTSMCPLPKAPAMA